MKKIRSIGKWLVITLLVALFSGLSSALFLFLLEFVGKSRSENHWFYLTLPFFGLFVVYIYDKWSPDAHGGYNLVLSEIYDPKKTLSKWMSPLVLIGTLLTHLGGGSAGREGTAVQMGASLSDLLNQPFSLSKEERKRLLKMGIAGGFAAVFGTPLAASVFAIEVLRNKGRKLSDILFIALTAHLANFICHLTTISHTDYHFNVPIPYSADFLFWLFLSAVFFGLVSLIYIFLSNFFKQKSTIFFPNPYLRIFIGGSLISMFFLSSNLDHLSGLGVQTIVSSFSVPTLNFDFAFKILLTTFTLGVGFKGGEVTPLFFIGATLANLLSFWIPLPLPIIVSCGFVSVFGASTKTPYASSVMGAEIFGWEYFLIFLVSCYISSSVSGNQSVYSAQMKDRLWWQVNFVNWLTRK